MKIMKRIYAEITSTNEKKIDDEQEPDFNEQIEEAKSFLGIYQQEITKVLNTAFVIKLLSLDVTTLRKLFVDTKIYYRQSTLANSLEYLEQIIKFLYIDLKSFYKKNDAILQLFMNDQATYNSLLVEPSYIKTKNMYDTLKEGTAIINANSSHSVFMIINEFQKKLLALSPKKRYFQTYQERFSLFNTLLSMIKDHYEHMKKFKIIMAILNRDDINAKFKIQLNKYIQDNTNNNIITCLKIRNDQHISKSYNERFDISHNGTQNTNVTELIIKYNDANIPYYRPSTGTIKFPAHNAQPKGYNHTYLVGPFTHVFLPDQSNKEIADKLKIIKTKLLDGIPVFMLGYGASGAGKTSTLIFFNKGKTDEEKNGILVHLCNQLGEEKHFDKIELQCKEFYQRDSTKPVTTVTIPEKGSLSFSYKDSSFISDTDITLPTQQYYRTKKTETTFPAETLLGEIIIHMIDVDRFVKATTNNPNSSRSHCLIFVTLKGKKENGDPIQATLIFGDFAGVENTFTCEDPKTIKAFLNVRRDGTNKDGSPLPPYYSTEGIGKIDNPAGYISDPAGSNGMPAKGGVQKPIQRTIPTAKNSKQRIVPNSKLVTPTRKNVKPVTKPVINPIPSPATQSMIASYASIVPPPFSKEKTCISAIQSKDSLFDMDHPSIRDSWNLTNDQKNFYSTTTLNATNLTSAFQLIRAYIGSTKSKKTIESIHEQYTKMNQSEFRIKLELYLSQTMGSIDTLIETIENGINIQYASKDKIVLRDDLSVIVKSNPSVYKRSEEDYKKIRTPIITALKKVLKTTYFEYLISKIPFSELLEPRFLHKKSGRISLKKFMQTYYDQIKKDYTLIEQLSINIIHNSSSENSKEKLKGITEHIFEIHGSYPTLIEIVRDMEIEIECRIANAMVTCNHRREESYFINNSIKIAREVIKLFLYIKNKDAIQVTPQFIDNCLDSYCPAGENCFQLSPAKKGELKSSVDTKSVIFHSIFEVLTSLYPKYQEKNGLEAFCKDIVIGVFCVFNISKGANNPPPTPYLDINDLKIQLNLKWNPTALMNSITPILTRIETSPENGGYADKLDSLRTITASDKPNKTIYEIIKELVNDIENDISESDYNDSYKKYVNEFIDMIDNSNAVSAIGTVDFTDKFSKYFTTKAVCKRSNDASKNIQNGIFEPLYPKASEGGKRRWRTIKNRHTTKRTLKRIVK